MPATESTAGGEAVHLGERPRPETPAAMPPEARAAQGARRPEPGPEVAAETQGLAMPPLEHNQVVVVVVARLLPIQAALVLPGRCESQPTLSFRQCRRFFIRRSRPVPTSQWLRGG